MFNHTFLAKLSGKIHAGTYEAQTNPCNSTGPLMTAAVLRGSWGSWVAISGVISLLMWLISVVTLLITPLITI